MHAVEPADRFVLMSELMLWHYRTPRVRTFAFSLMVVTNERLELSV